jgi:cysteine synthase A
MRYDSILETIGRTPVVRIGRLAPPRVQLYAKLEAFNPMGSVKDRMARAVIEDAERNGRLRPGQTVVEATSGNTGIALAMVCAQKGYPLVIVMAENFSIERRRLMRFLGAKVVLTPAAQKGSGMLAKATELAGKHGWFLARQFENEANAEVHSHTTAAEILEDFADVPLDYWVTGAGTGGTLKGVARVLRERSPRTRVVVCEPENSPLLGSGIAQPRSADGTPSASHPRFRPHPVQGWSPDFLPKLAEDALAAKLVDRVMPVSGAEALRLSQALAREEGIFTGISGGATLAGALAIAREAPLGTSILCMLPDTGERYLSTPLFADVAAEMNDEELAISRSTPGFRFDPPASSGAPSATGSATGAAAAVRAPSGDPAIDAYLSEVVGDARQPVVMFSLEWCEFCWSVRRFLARLKVPFRAIDLDSAGLQAEDRGGRIRAALGARTSMSTIPQIFVGGEFIGGCTELFDAWRAGRLQVLLERSAVAYDGAAQLDPYVFLPSWLHPR